MTSPRWLQSTFREGLVFKFKGELQPRLARLDGNLDPKSAHHVCNLIINFNNVILSFSVSNRLDPRATAANRVDWGSAAAAALTTELALEDQKNQHSSITC